MRSPQGNMMSSHLDRPALLRWQAGEANPAERQHVRACNLCQQKLAPLESALACFGAAAREWGDAKAVQAQQRLATRPAVETHRTWQPRLAALAMVCAVLLLAVGIALPRWQAHRAALAAQAQQLAQTQERQRQQELARDNALLEAVDQDVSQVVPEAMRPLSWNTGGAPGRATRNQARQ